MARKRMIDPSIWQSISFAKLSYFERILFIGMISNADDFGKNRAKPELIIANIFPNDEKVRVSHIVAALKNIKRYCDIDFYTVDEIDYYIFRKWDYWQTINRKFPSNIPFPANTQSQTNSLPESLTESTTESLPESLHKVIEGNRSTEGNRSSDTDEATAIFYDTKKDDRKLIELYRELNAKTNSTQADINIEKDLRSRHDFDETKALDAMRKCHLTRITKEPGWRASSLNYYVPAIKEALEGKNGNGGSKISSVDEFEEYYDKNIPGVMREKDCNMKGEKWVEFTRRRIKVYEREQANATTKASI